jgi:hypothetical protein
MLDKFIMTIGVLFLLMAFALGGAELVSMVFVEFDVQNEAQQVAMSEGHYGGYTSDEQAAVEQYVSTYCQKQGVNTSESQAVSVTAPGAPANYGTNVTATLTMPFKFALGSFMPAFNVNLTGTGRSVSSYIQDMTPDVAYASP